MNPNRKKYVFLSKNYRNRAGIGPFGVKKIADELGRRGENFVSAGSGRFQVFWTIFRENLPEIFINIVYIIP